MKIILPIKDKKLINKYSMQCSNQFFNTILMLKILYYLMILTHLIKKRKTKLIKECKKLNTMLMVNKWLTC